MGNKFGLGWDSRAYELPDIMKRKSQSHTWEERQVSTATASHNKKGEWHLPPFLPFFPLLLLPSHSFHFIIRNHSSQAISPPSMSSVFFIPFPSFIIIEIMWGGNQTNFLIISPGNEWILQWNRNYSIPSSLFLSHAIPGHCPFLSLSLPQHSVWEEWKKLEPELDPADGVNPHQTMK